MPGSLPRSTKPTPQRLTTVAIILSEYLTQADLAHAFLGRFALSLRGAPYSPKWIDIDVSRPTLGGGGTMRVKELLSAHPDFAVHSEVKEGALDRMLVTHKCGIYIRLSVGYVRKDSFLKQDADDTMLCRAIAHVRRKLFHLSVPITKSRAPAVLPLLAPARQFLETVIVASGQDGRQADAEDLIWMYENLQIELLNDANTLKKTWDEGRLQKVIDRFPIIGEAVVSLGLGALHDEGQDAAQVRSPNIFLRILSLMSSVTARELCIEEQL